MTDIEAMKEFYKDHMARISMDKPIADPFLAGLARGRRHQLDDLWVVKFGLERLIRDTNIDADVQARAQRVLHDLREVEI